jgi:hypothetical protein
VRQLEMPYSPDRIWGAIHDQATTKAAE